MLNELALFAGAGGGILASHFLLGHRVVCAVEKDGFRREVLLRRQRDGVLPLFPIWDDVHTFDARPWRGLVDVVSAGFPCQRFSTATRGRPTAPDLWDETLRVIAESLPRWVFIENVSGAKKRLEQAREDLEHLGFGVRGPWLVSASYVGAPHSRERLWLFGDAHRYSKSGEPEYEKVAKLFQASSPVWTEALAEDLRVDDGLANRMDRLKALGDGQVPLVAATAWALCDDDQ